MHRRGFVKRSGVMCALSLGGCLGEGEREPEREPVVDHWSDRVTWDEAVDTEAYVEAFRYAFDPTSVRVTLGDRVGLAMTSTDNGYHAGHGIGIDEFDVRIEAREEDVDQTIFTADQPGNFEMWCTVWCSDGHHGMRGSFVVEP